MLKIFKAWTITKIGLGVATTGIIIEQLALVGIMLGVILMMFKYRTLFKWSLVMYFIGLVIEILGSVII